MLKIGDKANKIKSIVLRQMEVLSIWASILDSSRYTSALNTLPRRPKLQFSQGNSNH